MRHDRRGDRAHSSTSTTLILLDYRLPDANGLALLDWLTEHQRDEAVIIISGEDAIDRDRRPAPRCRRLRAQALPRRAVAARGRGRPAQGIAGKGQQADEPAPQGVGARHRYLVESSPDLIFTLDSAEYFTYLNPRVKALLGYDRSALMPPPRSPPW